MTRDELDLGIGETLCGAAVPSEFQGDTVQKVQEKFIGVLCFNPERRERFHWKIAYLPLAERPLPQPQTPS